MATCAIVIERDWSGGRCPTATIVFSAISVPVGDDVRMDRICLHAAERRDDGQVSERFHDSLHL